MGTDVAGLQVVVAEDSLFFFFNDTATTEIYTLSLHDALPISRARGRAVARRHRPGVRPPAGGAADGRSEEHTSELQSQSNLVCRLLLEKKKRQGLPEHRYSNFDGAYITCTGWVTKAYICALPT